MGYKTAGPVAWRRLGDETVVLHLARKRAYGLSPAAGPVWEALTRGATREGLESVLGAARPGALEAFLADLATEGLLEEGGPSSPDTAAPPEGPPEGNAPGIVWREALADVVQLSCTQFPTQCGDVPET